MLRVCADVCICIICGFVCFLFFFGKGGGYHMYVHLHFKIRIRCTSGINIEKGVRTKTDTLKSMCFRGSMKRYERYEKLSFHRDIQLHNDNGGSCDTVLSSTIDVVSAIVSFVRQDLKWVRDTSKRLMGKKGLQTSP